MQDRKNPAASSDVITVQEAEKLILESTGTLPSETIPIAQAIGRVLREPIRADRALPPFDRATLDGVAIFSGTYNSGRKKFNILGTAAAGSPQQTLDNQKACLEIMTGAVLPRGTDCVVKVEDLELDDNTALLNSDLSLSPGTGVHYTGSDCAKGTTLLESGVTITAKEIAIAASVGKYELLVSTLPRIAVVTTGDELVAIEETPEQHQIRRSNDITLAAALQAAGYPNAQLVHISDDPEQIENKLREILETHDTIILAGGVSKGKYDYIPETLRKLGVATRFQWVTQRPGKPMWYGQLNRNGAQVPIFALPGNPVSCFTCLRRYVLPALDKWTGKPTAKIVYAKIEHDLTFKPEITLLLPVSLNPRPSGETWAKPILFNTSGDFVSVAKTDGFIELPKTRKTFLEGEPFRYFNWPV